ncbi:MAG: OsmC family protein [Firmicutes bacterium]|nr:OsmC family protein [Bacillota bacterium]
MDEFSLNFPGGKKVEVIYGNHVVMTDQPLENGGDDHAMAPFDLFMASLISCSGIFALSFLRKRDLNTEGLNIRMYPMWNEEEHRVTEIKMEVDTPADFPEKYKGALIKVIEQCSVKRHLGNPPEFSININ